MDALALDIQRSLDYFDSQLGMGMVGQLWVLVPDNADVSELLPELERSVNLPVRSLLLDSVARQQGGEDLTASLAIALGNALLIEQSEAVAAAGKVA
jgi:MSHA biogenesis protein MshI